MRPLAMPLLDPNQSYTFSRYFDLGFEASELAQEFGYKLTRKPLKLPQFPGELDRLQELRDRIEEVLPFVPLTNEFARREIPLSRVVTELIHYTQAQLRIEYGLKVSNWLQGSLDYLLRVNPVNQLLVIEAKYEDLTRGFTQLVAELVALDQTVGDAIAHSVCCRIGITGRGVSPQLQDLHEPLLVTSA